jgi:hypothetical protein
MMTEQPVHETPGRGEKFERLAFTFCKAATLILIARKFALPVAAGGAALFYVLAIIYGKRDTRCWLRFPAVIAAFWMVVAGLSLYGLFRGGR